MTAMEVVTYTLCGVLIAITVAAVVFTAGLALWLFFS